MKLIESKAKYIPQMKELKDFIKENKLLSAIPFITGVSYLLAFIMSILNLMLYLL